MISRDLVVQPLQHDGRSNKQSDVGRRWHSGDFTLAGGKTPESFAAGRHSGRQMEASPASSVSARSRGFPSSRGDPLLNFVGGHAPKVRLRLSGRHGFPDPELPIPHARLRLNKAEINALAVCILRRNPATIRVRGNEALSCSKQIRFRD
jgi:hypothetical protein